MKLNISAVLDFFTVDPITIIGSRKAAVLANGHWSISVEVDRHHFSGNRWKRSRIYKDGKTVRNSNKYALAEALNTEAVAAELPYEEFDFERAAVHNLTCGCNITVLESDEQVYVERCFTDACLLTGYKTTNYYPCIL